MYLLVFVTLIIGMVGIYAQVLSLQAARIAASQTGLAKAMMVWHGGAVSMASAIINTSPAIFTHGSSPCSLTYTVPSGVGISKCTKPSGSGDPFGVVMDNSNSLYHISATEYVHIPTGFTTQFYSILYEDTSVSQYYVVTFLAKPTISATNPAPGFLALPPNNRLISFTNDDLLHQLSLSGLPSYSYGAAKSTGGTSVLVSPGFGRGGTANSFQYNLPLLGGSGILSTGTVGMVSPASG